MKIGFSKFKIGRKRIKSIMVLLLMFIYCLNTYSAAVSDNDGSAFITKAEYDSLKNNFQSQINGYNTQLDAKIDSAISGYLAGIKTEKTRILDNYVEKIYATNKWATSFADKTSPITGSSNTNFTKGGWWLWWVYGWNTGESTVNGQCNLASGTLTDHALHILPGSVSSLKWFVKAYESNGSTYYGPYDNKLYNMNQTVYVQKVVSTYRNGSTTHPVANKRTTDQTFDLTALSAPGTTNVGSYNAGWTTFNNIEGTILLSYSLYGDNKRQWAAMSSTGGCDTSSTSNYCVDYDKQLDLTEESTENTRFTGSSFGSQWQEFYPRSGSTVSATSDNSKPKFTLKFKTPKVLALRNADLCNWVASEYIGQVVPAYAGIPMTKVSKKGKLKLKFHIENLDLSSDSPIVTDNVTVAIKAAQFNNSGIDSESKLLFKDENCKHNEEYSKEFDVDVDKDTILYIKADSKNSASYVRVFIDGNPTYTIE